MIYIVQQLVAGRWHVAQAFSTRAEAEAFAALLDAARILEHLAPRTGGRR